jgi:hypothetical protein
MTALSRLYDDSKFLGTWLFMPTLEYKVNPSLDFGRLYLREGLGYVAGDDFKHLPFAYMPISNLSGLSA